MLSEEGKGGVLRLDDKIPSSTGHLSVKEALKSKHPQPQTIDRDVCITGTPPQVHPISFEGINLKLIRSCALKASGACGPSGLEAYDWRRLCTSFQAASDSLCEALARVAKRLCITHINPEVIAPILACGLIALDKCPGVRPIGIGDMARRIMSKAVLQIVRGDVQDATSSRQLCAGQIAGVETAIHSVHDSFELDDTEAVLLIDASNAFNSLNRKVALHNIQFTCPELSTILQNTYGAPSDLFIDGETIKSQEGTTQGDPLAMPMYALATLPLMEQLPQDVTQVWYADDACATGKLTSLRNWWDTISTVGQKFGYFVNASKTWLITKEALESHAAEVFSNSSVNITVHGRPYLGTPLGSPSFVKDFVCEKVATWKTELQTLCEWACSQPHAAFAVYTHVWSSRWTFLTRTVPNVGHLLTDLEDMIQSKLLPALTGRPPLNHTERELLSLPAKHGGIGMVNPTTCNHNYETSRKITELPVQEVLSNTYNYSVETNSAQYESKREAQKQRNEHNIQTCADLKFHLQPAQLKAIELAAEKGASAWITALPLREFSFNLHKGAYRDALALGYGWPPQALPATCVCGAHFSVEHALSCPRGAFPIIRHNEIRDLTASLLTEVCHDVRVETELQPLEGETMSNSTANTSQGARLDIAANGFWGGRFERSFIDVKVFNPFAPSNRKSPIATCYRSHENQKKRAYEQRVREVEHGTFTPLVMSATGGLARQATTFYKRLADLLATKHNQAYSKTMNWMRCRLTFSLLRSAIQCIRGSRSSGGKPIRSPQIDLACSEAQV